MKILYGMHGTSAMHSNNIVNNSFLIPNGNAGKGGSGIYFWNYEKHSSNAKKLCKVWWEWKFKQNNTSNSTSFNFSLFDVSIEVPEENFLDFSTNIALREAFLEVYPHGQFKQEIYGEKLDLFIKEIEDDLQESIDVIRIDLSAPKFEKTAFSNSSPAVIVKSLNNASISILNCFSETSFI